MDSNEIKVKLLHYWRYNRRYKYFATEYGRFDADVMVSDGKEQIECEVKVSAQDLKNDLKKKKHQYYQEASHTTYYWQKWIPNKFFFAVPEELLNTAIETAKPYGYGVVLVNSKELSLFKQRKPYVKIAMNAKVIHSYFSDKSIYSLIDRMGSDIIRTKTRNVRLQRIYNLAAKFVENRLKRR